MKTDKAFEELRAETGSPLPVRLPFGVFGIIINPTFAIWGWGDPPPFVIAAIALTMVPTLIATGVIFLRFMARKGMFFGWRHPVLYNRWGFWLLLWPSPDEPRWRKAFAIGVLTWSVTSTTIGVVAWGFSPTSFSIEGSLDAAPPLGEGSGRCGLAGCD